MKKLLYQIIILCVLLNWGCKNNNQSDNSEQKVDHSTAIPDGSSVTDAQLSDADKMTLANVNGKNADVISMKDLNAMFEHSDEQLHIYSFWKNHNLNCTEVNRTLLEIQKEVGDSTLRIIFVNLDDSSKKPLVNAFIREYGVTSNVFVTSDSLNIDWYNQIHMSWSGEVPAIYLKNKTDGIDLFYQKKFTAEELSVLIQPFTL